jgi:hypothetical protein
VYEVSDIKPLDIEESLILHLDKKVGDRTNIILAVNTFLFDIFISLITAEYLPGFLFWIPIIICFSGLALNFFLSILNQRQMEKIRELSLKHEQLDYKNSLEDLFNYWVPRILTFTWLFCGIICILYQIR